MKLFRNNRTQSYSQPSPSSSRTSTSTGPSSTANGLTPVTSAEVSASALTSSPTTSFRPLVSRSTSEAVSPTRSTDISGLPDYAPRPPALAVPSYNDSFGRSSVEGAVARRESFASPTGQRLIRDYFDPSPATLEERTLEEGEEDDDDPLTPRPLRPPPMGLAPLRRATLPVLPRVEPAPPEPEANGSTTLSQLPLELPPPPANALPAYTPHLAHDELRLISSVHLDQNHPAAAFFSAMTGSVNRANQAESEGAQTEEMTTGGKKLKVVLTRGGRRLNENGTGPIFIRLGRGGSVEGRVEIGKVDHGISLEASILGLVNTSYYVRGQYTLIDTMPLARRRVVLFPPDADPSEIPDPEALAAAGSTPSASAGPSTSPPDPGGTTNGDTSDAVVPTAPAVNGKEPTIFMTPGQSFPFSLKIPAHHYRDEDIELPPSCQVFQVGLQAGVEYVLRIKLARKGWRLNETLAVPIIYEPRAYLPPRRLRALTTNDALNPGWRTIRLTGGAPVKVTDPPSPGVEVTLLLPSPPILFVPHETVPPPIPFHLHFHSPLTLPLATFSDPKECTFVVRLMRVTMIRISTEKEIRRMEMKSKTEVWQEGSAHITLGEEVQPIAAAIPTPFTNGENGGSGTGSLYPTHMPGGGRRASSSGGERRRSFSDRRPSFLRRRSSTVEQSEAETPPQPNGTTAAPSVPPISEEPVCPPAVETIAPLSLDATDVHLLGQLTIIPPNSNGSSMTSFRTLVQSFSTPEIAISYVLEVGLQPKKGAVREAFSHVWGGGLVEVVLGNR